MLNYLVIGLCLALLIAVIYFSIKPISMGIEARRNINDKDHKNNLVDDLESNEIINESNLENNNLSDELTKLNQLKIDGVLTEEEYEKAKKKVVGLGRFNFFLYKFRNFFLFINCFIFFAFRLINDH